MRVIVLATAVAVATAGLVSAPSAAAPAAARGGHGRGGLPDERAGGHDGDDRQQRQRYNGVVNPAGVTAGQTYDGATGYVWSKRSPTAPPPSPERVITVPDNPNLEPGDRDFTLEFRYRNEESYGNIIQKGQSTQVGGQWKVQNPGGQPSCLFKGSDRRPDRRPSRRILRQGQPVART